ncbi:HNH endonuclease signature motif containing protein [Microbacterium sp. Leaf288]|uniref:HNH endonuclease signature motif containing protein n=1 Tax=Microbacterium sp. Leaf288 TaxID=1736323 RepID=UPI0009E98EB0|nr:HNH endonuclease signature motif containing protein [Microbacterium sp. Leaf288]
MNISPMEVDLDSRINGDPELFLDPWDVLDPGEVVPPIELAQLEASGAAHEAAVNKLEGISARARMLVADEYAGIADILRDAAACPDPWVGPDPTLDPAWLDPQGRSAAAVRAERRNIAVRAATLDLAVRLGMSAMMVSTRAAHADTLRERCPNIWEAFRAGRVPTQNATAAAQQAGTLPARDRGAWAKFDELLRGSATTLTPGKFRTRARVVRERVHPEHIDERHTRAMDDRNVWFQAEADGMASLIVFGPADKVLATYRHADAHARHLRAHDGEERTLAQLRADIVLDVLAAGAAGAAQAAGSGTWRSRASVAITVPVMTLLGHDNEPATLDGYGPIDTETARRLAGEASSWVRILTHPVTGTVLDVDRTTYRVPKALSRWLGVRDQVCTGPGCTRSARDCDIDHRIDWQYGGKTADTNLSPLCERHHVIKTKSKWVLYRDETTGAKWWVSPTSLTVPVDPPPF